MVAGDWPVFVVAESTICGLCGGIVRLRVGERFLVGTGVSVVGVRCAKWADYSDRGAAHGRGVWRRLSTLLSAGAQVVVKRYWFSPKLWWRASRIIDVNHKSIKNCLLGT